MLDTRVITFLAVCRNMNYTKAANELNLTQPAVSQHIKFLEDYYDCKLFTYTNKKLVLTPQGQFLKNTMETFYHDSSKVQENILRINTPQTVNIGATMSIGEYYLPDKISKFMNLHPEINLNVQINDTANLLSTLDSGKVDFILCEGYFKKAEYDFKFIKEERILGLCAKNYQLPRKITGIENLFDCKVILREPGSGTRDVFERYLTSKGYSLNNFEKQASLTSPKLILKLLLDCQGISFLYESVGHELIKEKLLREIKIPDFNLSHEFNAIWKKNSLFSSLYMEYIDELCSASR